MEEVSADLELIPSKAANECDSKSNPETVDALSVHSFAGILSLKVSGEAANEIDSTSTASSEKAGEEEAETTGEAVAGAKISSFPELTNLSQFRNSGTTFLSFELPI